MSVSGPSGPQVFKLCPHVCLFGMGGVGIYACFALAYGKHKILFSETNRPRPLVYDMYHYLVVLF